jgi:hypothetical protein
MSWTDLLRGRGRVSGRLPASLSDLHGPEQGVIVLPRHLARPGLREFDVTDDRLRRSLYSLVLTYGRRNDIARFLNSRLLRQDWPLLRTALEPRVRRGCERRLKLLQLGVPPRGVVAGLLVPGLVVAGSCRVARGRGAGREGGLPG